MAMKNGIIYFRLGFFTKKNSIFVMRTYNIYKDDIF